MMFIRYFIFLLFLFSTNVHAQDYYDDYGYDEYGYDDEYADEYGDEYDDEYADEYGDEYDDEYDDEYADEYGDEYDDEYADEYGDEYGDEYADEYDDEYTEGNNDILQRYKSPFVIDPVNPKLPPNHHISKLKGTVWRSDDIVLKTNSRGVVSEQRLYIFFNKNRDAISYQYANVRSVDVPMWPDDSLFIALKPVAQTNNFIESSSSTYIPSIEHSGNMQHTINLLEMRNYRYEEALEKLLVTNRIETNTTMEIVTNTIFEIVTNTTSEILSNVLPYSDFKGKEFNNMEYPIDYNKRYSFDSHYIPMRVLAQDINNNLPESQYLVVLGGEYGGVFVHETGDDRFPYKIITLQLDQSGVYLYEYHADSNSPTTIPPQPAQTNMKRFQRVRLNREFLY